MRAGSLGSAPLALVHGREVGDINQLGSAIGQDWNRNGDFGLVFGRGEIRGVIVGADGRAFELELFIGVIDIVRAG